MIAKIKIRHLIWLGFLLSSKAFGQFYNGHQMSFGKSRVQYIDFYWQYYRFDKFDTYFYVGGNELAKSVSEIASSEIEKTEFELQEVLQQRIIFIVYNKHSEFKQSNIGLISGIEESNIGGVTKIVNNKVFVYYEGDHIKLQKQIKASVAEILINEMLYGGTFRSKVSTSALLNLPEWFMPGLISYIAYDSDFETEAKIKNAVLDGQIQKMHRQHGEEATVAGHAFWRYLSETYGKEIISQIIYMTRISKSVENGFLYVLGMPLKNIINDWFYFYQGRYEDEIKNRQQIPKDSKHFVKKSKNNCKYNQVKMSPDGEFIAYTTNQEGQYKIFTYNTTTQKTKRIAKREHKLEQITDYSYPILEWHPAGNILTYIYERQGKIWLTYHNMETKEKQTRQIFEVTKILNYSFSQDGQHIVFSAVKNGYTDIILFSVGASTYNHITKDIADDLYPKFIENSEKIIFSSNRKTEQLKFEKDEEQDIANNFDLFIYNTKNENLKRLTNSPKTNEFKPIGYAKNKYFYLTDANGLYNTAFAKSDSSVSYIDTAIHYRNFTKTYPITNRAFNINDYDFNTSNKNFTEVVRETKKYSLFTSKINPKLKPNPNEYKNTWFKNYINEEEINDSIIQASRNAYEPDSLIIKELKQTFNDTLIDINNYVFEIEKQDILKSEKKEQEKSAFKLPKQLVYFTNFYANSFVTQIDFGFMKQSYQLFTGNAFYFNPGFNFFTKIGAIDLFEDYKITGGIRFSVDFKSNEYLLSVENLKKRLDKQYIYHRQSFETVSSESYSKVLSNRVMAVFKYPITQIHSFQGTISGRLDKKVYKSIPYIPNSLFQEDEFKYWGGLKGEYILDNTKSLGLNLLKGIRLKVFGEYYNQIGEGSNAHLFVVGTDIRSYLHIHRDLIFASRFAYSSSFGNSQLIYYLGGVDSWINFSRKTPTFDYSTRINPEKNWAFQAVATNMRGFVQNARNGNSFAVANFELRCPVIRYALDHPINNDFLNNFMIIGFTDIGSAWEDWNPLKSENAYDHQEIYQKPVKIVVDRKRSPIIAGVGFGLRSRLLGYYIRTDWAWGIDGGKILPRVFYLSLSTDF